MRRLFLASSIALGVVLAGCGADAQTPTGPSGPSAPAEAIPFALTIDQAWDRYPTGAEWASGGLLVGTVATAKIKDRDVAACGKKKVPIPESVTATRIESTIVDSTISSTTDTVIFPDTKAATDFYATLKTASLACESVVQPTSAPIYFTEYDTDQIKAGRAQWTGYDIEFPYQAGRAAMAFRTRGNVVVVAFSDVQDSADYAHDMAYSELGRILGLLEDHLGGNPTPYKAAEGLVDVNALCNVVSKDALKKMLGGHDYDKRIIKESTFGYQCSHGASSGANVTIIRFKTTAPADKIAVVDGGVGVSRNGVLITITVSPKPKLSKAEWTKIGEDIQTAM